MAKPLSNATVRQALRHWGHLQPVLMKCNERQSLQLLKAEQGGKARHWMLRRIGGHYYKLKHERERFEMLQFIAKKKLAELKGVGQ